MLNHPIIEKLFIWPSCPCLFPPLFTKTFVELFPTQNWTASNFFHILKISFPDIRCWILCGFIFSVFFIFKFSSAIFYFRAIFLLFPAFLLFLLRIFYALHIWESKDIDVFISTIYSYLYIHICEHSHTHTH